MLLGDKKEFGKCSMVDSLQKYHNIIANHRKKLENSGFSKSCFTFLGKGDDNILSSRKSGIHEPEAQIPLQSKLYGSNKHVVGINHSLGKEE